METLYNFLKVKSGFMRGVETLITFLNTRKVFKAKEWTSAEEDFLKALVEFHDLNGDSIDFKKENSRGSSNAIL